MKYQFKPWISFIFTLVVFLRAGEANKDIPYTQKGSVASLSTREIVEELNTRLIRRTEHPNWRWLAPRSPTQGTLEPPSNSPSSTHETKQASLISFAEKVPTEQSIASLQAQAQVSSDQPQSASVPNSSTSKSKLSPHAQEFVPAHKRKKDTTLHQSNHRKIYAPKPIRPFQVSLIDVPLLETKQDSNSG